MIRPPFHPITSLLNLLGGREARPRKAPKHARRRRLGFEWCEDRALLNGASITGVKFLTANPSGFSAGDVPQGGVFIDLYKDNGDDIFDVNSDPLADRQQTATPSGVYTFANVADGHYFIQEEVPAGFVQSAGPAFYTVDVVSGAVYTGGTTSVDDFSDPDPAATYFINATNPDPLLLQHSGSGILGTQRDLLIDVLGLANPISANGFVGTVSPGKGVFNLGAASSGPGTAATLQYDGVDADTTALNDAMGLSADLTAGGANGIRLDFNFLQIGSGPTIDLNISATSPGGTASFSGTVAANTGAFSVLVPFSSFTPVGSFTFADVKSLKLALNQSGELDVDLELNQIVAVQQKNSDYNFGNFPIAASPSSLSGFVYCDGNKNGMKDKDEKGIRGVKIKLTGTDDQGNPVNLTTTTDANGFYIFDNLRPGTYTITQCQPKNVTDGKDTIGTPGGDTGNDVFSNIILPAGFEGVDNNFGERGCKTACSPKKDPWPPLKRVPFKVDHGNWDPCGPISKPGNDCSKDSGKNNWAKCDPPKKPTDPTRQSNETCKRAPRSRGG